MNALVLDRNRFFFRKWSDWHVSVLRYRRCERRWRCWNMLFGHVLQLHPPPMTKCSKIQIAFALDLRSWFPNAAFLPYMLLPFALLAYHEMLRMHLFDRDDTSGGVLMMRWRNEWLGRIGSQKKVPFFVNRFSNKFILWSHQFLHWNCMYAINQPRKKKTHFLDSHFSHWFKDERK